MANGASFIVISVSIRMNGDAGVDLFSVRKERALGMEHRTITTIQRVRVKFETKFSLLLSGIVITFCLQC